MAISRFLLGLVPRKRRVKGVEEVEEVEGVEVVEELNLPAEGWGGEDAKIGSTGLGMTKIFWGSQFV